jgi:uracil-DNA glycosylase
MVVGEAPGRFEDEQGRPFVGRAGQLLDEVLAEAGFARSDVFITNVVKARPPGNRDPTRAEVEHWMPVLEQQLALVAPRLVVPLGRHALAHFAGGARISDVHGRELTARGRTLFPLYHPAAGLRSTLLRETLFADARSLRSALDQGLALERELGAHERAVAGRADDLEDAVGGADPVGEPAEP